MRKWLVRFGIWGVCAVAAGAVGCGIDTQPMPEITGQNFDDDNGNSNERTDEEDSGVGSGDAADAPDPSAGASPFIDQVLIFHSGPADGSAPRLLVGTPNTVGLSNAEYRVSNVTRPDAGTLRKASAADGSFNATFDAAVGETVLLELFDVSSASDAGPIDSTTIRLFEASTSAGSNSDALAVFLESGNPVASAPNASGLATLTIPADTVPPDTEFIAANTTSGNSVLALSEPDGSVIFTITAISGDQIDVFGVDAMVSNGGGASVSVVIP
ncbi:MAG: hypothetical protein AAF658_00075 [Myxococcota bacterium]